jgi:23S rRNA (guanosine2251-2'-O)-methyltransferase
MREILFGRRAVRECLRAGRRQAYRLLIAEGVRESDVLGEIVGLAERAPVPLQRVPRASLDQIANGGNPQGVALETARYPYADLDEILALAGSRGEPPFILLLDLLQDPQNVGTLLRTAAAVGVHGAVLQERRSAEITPAVANASAGAVEHLRIAQETNLARTMESLKTKGVWLMGLEAKGAERIDRAKLTGPLGLVVGSEGEGLRRLVREKCDFLVRLPMRGQIESLNAATAGSIALYYVWAARGFAGEREDRGPLIRANERR